MLRRAHRHPVGGVGGHRREQPRQPFGDGQPPFGIDDVERHGKLAAETAQQQLGPADVGGHQRAKHRAVDGNQPRRTAGNRIDLALQPGEEGKLAEDIARPQHRKGGEGAILGIAADEYMPLDHGPEGIARIALMLDELAVRKGSRRRHREQPVAFDARQARSLGKGQLITSLHCRVGFCATTPRKTSGTRP